MASSCWPWPFPLLVCSQTGREKRRMAQEDRNARLLVKIVPVKFIKSPQIADGPPFCQAGSINISARPWYIVTPLRRFSG